MSKPRPFTSSFWGIAIILVIAGTVLGINNYRGNRAGFNLTFSSAIVTPADKKQANTFQLVTTAEQFAKLCQPTQPVSINWDKQLAFVYLAPSQPTGGYQIKPLFVHRDSTTVNISYRLVAPATDRVVTQVISYPGIAVLIDRTKLISSSDLIINSLVNNEITQSLKIAPNQI